MSTTDNYNVNIVKNEGLYREIIMTFTKNSLQTIFDQEIGKVSKEGRFRGFRPGKVNREFILDNFGSEIVQKNLINFIRQSMNEVIESNKIEFLSKADEVKDIDYNNIQDVEVNIQGEQMPDFEEISPENIELEEVLLDKELDSKQDLVKIYSEWKKMYYTVCNEDETVKEGHKVTMNFDGKIDGKPFEGGTGTDLVAVIGKKQLMDGLEPQIIGMKLHEKKECSFIMDPNVKDESIRNKEVKMMIEITKIEKPDENMSDDDLIKHMKLKDLDDLHQKGQSFLENKSKNLANAVNRKKLFDVLDEKLDFNLPQFILSKEIEEIAKHYKDSKKEKSEEEVKKIATRRLKLAIFFIKFGRSNGVNMEQQDIINFIQNESRGNQQMMKYMVESYQKNQGFQQLVNNSILENKSADLFHKNTKKIQKPLSYSELEELYNQIDTDVNQ